MEEMTATDKTGVNADRANTAEQVDHTRADRFSWAKTEAKPGRYVANLLNSEVHIAPAEADAFIADVAGRSPHLVRRGHDLVLAAA
jgi:hypothetical protein